MNKYITTLFFLLEIFIQGYSFCSPINNNQGQVVIKFNKAETPENIVIIIATLSRPRFTSQTSILDFLCDINTEITFSSVPKGLWHLKVEASDSSNVVRFLGEVDVNVIENSVTQVNLSLSPTDTETGSIYVSVKWGTTSNNQWKDYQNNPLLSSLNSVYDDQGVSQAKVYYDGSKYMMWYIGLSHGKGYTLYAESLDGISWYRPISHPVLNPGALGSWDSHTVAPGPVIKERGIYKMYYQGYSDPNESSQIGLATSSDGKTWQKYPTPVLTGSAAWERQISPQSLVKREGTYYLYYVGRDKVYRGKIGLATSYDGISWFKYSGNPILVQTQDWEGTGVTCPQVIYDGGVFKMVYGTVSYQNNAVGMATSGDGKNWTKLSYNPIFKAQNTHRDWAISDISYPCFIKVDNEYRIYYSGWNLGKYKIGLTKLVP